MATKTLIPSQPPAVSASVSTQFYADDEEPVTLSATALAGSEEVDITYSGDGGTTFTVAYDYPTGSALVLTASKPQVTITGAGIYRVAKDSTASVCAVNLAKRGNIRTS